MEQQQLKNIIEAVLMSAEKPLKVSEIEALFAGDLDMPSRNEIRQALVQLAEDYQRRGFELKEVASGFRIQVRQEHAQWVGRLWEEKPARYSRALLETLALIAYRQPITRGEIEEIRGVSVSSNIIKTLQEREWIKVLGHKDVPGKPALYGTSKAFLDYFNLRSLEDLPTLAELRDLDQIHQELDLDVDNTAAQGEQEGQPQDEQRPEDALQGETETSEETTAEDTSADSAVTADGTEAEDNLAQDEQPQSEQQPEKGAQSQTEADAEEKPEDSSGEPVAAAADATEAEPVTGEADGSEAEPAGAQADDAETLKPVAIVDDDAEAVNEADSGQAEDVEKKPESNAADDAAAHEEGLVGAEPRRQSAAR